MVRGGPIPTTRIDARGRASQPRAGRLLEPTRGPRGTGAAVPAPAVGSDHEEASLATSGTRETARRHCSLRARETGRLVSNFGRFASLRSGGAALLLLPAGALGGTAAAGADDPARPRPAKAHLEVVVQAVQAVGVEDRSRPVRQRRDHQRRALVAVEETAARIPVKDLSMKLGVFSLLNFQRIVRPDNLTYPLRGLIPIRYRARERMTTLSLCRLI